MPVPVTVQSLVALALNEQKLSQSGAARRCGIHRNFLIDLLRGRIPTTRDGPKFADEDPRYAAVATGLGLDVPFFIALAKKAQQHKLREESIGKVINVSAEFTHSGDLAVKIPYALIEFGNFTLAFDIEDARVTITLAPKPTP